MKKRNIIPIILSCAVLAGCSDDKPSTPPAPSEVPYEPVSARSIVYSWQSAYEAKLSEFAASADFEQPTVSGVDGSMFDITDITGDDVPELIISHGSGRAAVCEVYTCDGGALKELGNMGRDFGTFTYYPQIGAVGEEYFGDGFVTGAFYKWNGTAFEQIMTYMDNSTAARDGVEIYHKIDNVEVNLPAYDEAMLPYTSAKTLTLGRRYTFGADAIDYALHCSESWGALNVLSPVQKVQYKSKLYEIAGYITDEDNYAFELVDIDRDDVPELVLSYGEKASSVCRIYKLGETEIIELDGGYGSNGRISLDLKNGAFYPPADDMSVQYIDGSQVMKYTRSDSIACVGRKYILDEASVDRSFT